MKNRLFASTLLIALAFLIAGCGAKNYDAVQYNREGQYDKAIENLNSHLNSKKLDKHEEYLIYCTRAESWTGKSDYGKAYKDYQKALDIINSEKSPEKRKLVHVYWAIGNLWQQQGQFEKAEASYKQAISIDPKYYDPFISLAKTYNDAGEYQKAVDTCNTYLRRIVPGISRNLFHAHAAIILQQGIAYLNLKQYQKAEDNFTRILKDYNRRESAALWNRSLVYERTGRYDEAIKDLKGYFNSLMIDPDMSKPLKSSPHSSLFFDDNGNLTNLGQKLQAELDRYYSLLKRK